MSDTVSPLSLALWARQFAAMVNVGVSLVRCLDVLVQASDEPLASITGQVQKRVEAGDNLSKSMAECPEVFNRLSIALCRAGEVGGILDETFAVWADWLERDLEFRARLDACVLMAGLRHPGRSREDIEAELRAALPDFEERVREMTFCRLFGMMLGSGVPVLQALDVAATEVYADGEERSRRLRDAILEPPQTLPPALKQLGYSSFTVQLAAIGEECGTLDRTMGKAADLFQHELEIRLSGAMAAMVMPQEPGAQVV
jgi:type II secretory pathway component PulF